jgi:hypothetical protein
MSDKKTLKQMILNECELQRGLAEILAKKAGYSSGSALKKILKDEKKEFEKFSALLDIVKTLFPDRKTELMAEYALTLDVKKQTARYMLEYCALNRLNDTKEYLIEQMVNCNNATSKDWAEIYETDSKYLSGQYNLDKAISSFSSMNPKQSETKVATQIYKAYCYLDEQLTDMVYSALVGVSVDIQEIKDDYIRDIFMGKYLHLLIAYYVDKGDLINARKHCLELIEKVNLPQFLTVAYLNLGNSYIVDNFSESLNYLTKGLNLSEDRFVETNKAFRRSLNFLHNVWGKNSEYLDLHSKEISDQHEVAFYYVNNKQNSKALNILDGLDQSQMSDKQKGFHFYIRGKLTNDMDMFYDSVYYFKEAKEFYFRRLPLLELQKLGASEREIRALSN